MEKQKSARENDLDSVNEFPIWLEMFVSLLSKLIFLLGLTIITSLSIAFIENSYKHSSKYLINIYQILFIYGLFASVTGAIGLFLNKNNSKILVKSFIIGAFILSLLFTLILALNFLRVLNIASKDPYDPIKYPWKLTHTENWLIVQNNVVECLKWNIAIIILCISGHYLIIKQLFKYYRLLY